MDTQYILELFVVLGNRASMGLLSLHHLWIHQSISLLMIKFYQNHLEEKLQIVQALNNAQNWLRKITKIELKKWIKNLPLDVTL